MAKLECGILCQINLSFVKSVLYAVVARGKAYSRRASNQRSELLVKEDGDGHPY